MHPVIKKTLDIARGEIGVREVRRNAGPRINDYLLSVGLGPGHPWCLAFVYWAAGEACEHYDIENPLPRTAYCPSLAIWARRQGHIQRQAPVAGAIFLRWGQAPGGARFSHAGLVSEVNGAQFGTIEGNTNLDGSREGIGVFERQRVLDSRYAFIDWGTLLRELDGQELDVARGTVKVVLSGKAIGEAQMRGSRAWFSVRDWGRALGLSVEWNQDAQTPILGGHELGVQVVLDDGRAIAPIRDLAAASGLRASYDADTRTVTVIR